MRPERPAPSPARAHRPARRPRPVRLPAAAAVREEPAGARFSYAASIEDPASRALGVAIERLSGRRRMERLYRRYRDEPHGDDFWDEALARMRVCVAPSGPGVSAIPREGPLVVVANHPFGTIDGIALAWAVGRVRGGVKLLAHEALARVPETRPHLLTIDFSEGREVERGNARARAAALAHLRAGGALVVFPAGQVMTTPGPFARRALDAPWGPLTARLVMRSGAAVLPVFIPGQNSRLFQVASHLSQTVRYALLFHETARHVGGRIELRIGRPIPPETTRSSGDAVAVTRMLRARTFALAEAQRPGSIGDRPPPRMGAPWPDAA